ncbi:hypothetical protein PENTCL1PPCAC_20206, partial [Pristionchus entomophagus]
RCIVNFIDYDDLKSKPHFLTETMTTAGKSKFFIISNIVDINEAHIRAVLRETPFNTMQSISLTLNCVKLTDVMDEETVRRRCLSAWRMECPQEASSMCAMNWTDLT